MGFILGWGLSIFYTKFTTMGVEPTALLLLCTCSNYWAICPNDEMGLTIYMIKWPRSSSHCKVITVAETESHLQLTFYIFSTFTLTQRSFLARPFISRHTNVSKFVFWINHGCVAEFANIYGIHFELWFFDSVQKVCPSGIWTHDHLLIKHTL